MAKGIFCLESDWDFLKTPKLLSNSTIEPMLEFLNKHEKLQYVYRKVATKDELLYCLKQLKKKEFDNFQIVYLSFHGKKQKISLAGEPKNSHIDLDELADVAKGAFKNRYVHFSSCETFVGTEEIFERFKKRTGAINDIAWYNELNSIRTNVDRAKTSFDNRYKGLIDELGFIKY